MNDWFKDGTVAFVLGCDENGLVQKIQYTGEQIMKYDDLDDDSPPPWKDHEGQWIEQIEIIKLKNVKTASGCCKYHSGCRRKWRSC